MVPKMVRPWNHEVPPAPLRPQAPLIGSTSSVHEVVGPFRFAPPPTPAALARPRVAAALAERFGLRCVLLEAGPGHGKTTALAQAIAENRLIDGGDDVWIGVEQADSDASVLAAAILQALGRPTTDPDADAIQRAIWERAPRDVCLILDDVHHITVGSSGSGLLAELCETLPTNGHLVCAARVAPALPYARLTARRSIKRLTDAELRFDRDELERFARLRSVGDNRFDATGGWPAMAELAAAARSDLAGEYLWDEVLQPLDSSARRALAVMCDLGGADDRLLAAVIDESVRIDTHIPLVERSADGWWVPHAMWRDIPALALDPGDRVEIRRKAARELTARGQLESAFALLAELELWDDIEPVLRAACAAARRPRAPALTEWLEACPPATLDSPIGRLAAGLLATLTEPETAIEPLRLALDAFRAAGDVDGELMAISHIGHLAYWKRDLTLLANHGARVAELSQAGHPVAIGLAGIGQALMRNMVGDDIGVIAALEATDGLDERWRAIAHFFRGLAYIGLGDEITALATFDAGIALADERFRLLLEANATILRWTLGDLDHVVDEADRLVAAAEANGIAAETVAFAAGSARACAWVGELERARSHLAIAESVAHAVAPPSRIQVVLARAAIAFAEGDEPAAVSLLSDALAEHPYDDPRAGGHWQTGLTLLYSLIPSTRAAIEAEHSARTARMRPLACVIAAARERSKDQSIAVTVDSADPGRVRGALGDPLAAEFAVALFAAGRRGEAEAILEALSRGGRDHLRRLGSKPTKSLLGAVPAPPPRVLTVDVFGETRVQGRSVDRARVRELLGYLVLHRRVERAVVGAALWPDLDDTAMANNLRVTISHLMQVLEPDRREGEASYFLRQDGSALRIWVDAALAIDVDRFDTEVRAARDAEASGAPSVALEHHQAAVALVRGEFLADLPDAVWADLERERLRSLAVRSAVRAGELLTASDRPDDAIRLGQRALQLDEWSEPAHLVLARAALVAGDRSAARRAVNGAREMLAELGVEASTALVALERRLREAPQP